LAYAWGGVDFSSAGSADACFSSGGAFFSAGVAFSSAGATLSCALMTPPSPRLMVKMAVNLVNLRLGTVAMG